MTDSLETPESMAEPWQPSATAVPQRAGKRPAPFTTVLVLTVEHSKPIDGLAALIESRISCMDGVLDVSSQPHSGEASQPTKAEAAARAFGEAFSEVFPSKPTQAEAPCERVRAWIDAAPTLTELSHQLQRKDAEIAELRAALATQQAVQGEPVAEPDMRAICEALGFDPTNHHNAAKCPYCRPAEPEKDERKPNGVPIAWFNPKAWPGHTIIWNEDEFARRGELLPVGAASSVRTGSNFKPPEHWVPLHTTYDIVLGAEGAAT